MPILKFSAKHQCCILTKMLQHLKKTWKCPENRWCILNLLKMTLLGSPSPLITSCPRCIHVLIKSPATRWQKMEQKWFGFPTSWKSICTYDWWLVSSYFTMTDFFKGYEDCFFNSHKTEGYGFLKKIASSFWKFSGCEYPAHAPPSNPLDKTHHHHIQITRLCPAL